MGAASWQFNGNYEQPSFSPSILIASGHYTSFWRGPECWCTYNRAHRHEPVRFRCYRCHSYVKGGRIEFLSDSTHKLAGQTAVLEAIPLPP